RSVEANKYSPNEIADALLGRGFVSREWSLRNSPLPVSLFDKPLKRASGIILTPGASRRRCPSRDKTPASSGATRPLHTEVKQRRRYFGRLFTANDEQRGPNRGTWRRIKG